MAIEETITVDVAGLGEVDDLAGALDKAAESAGKLKDELASLGGAGDAAAGAGKFADTWDSAFAKVGDLAKGFRDDMAGLGDVGGAAGAAGARDFAAAWDSALAGVSGKIDEFGGSAAGKLDDLGAGAGAAADEVKGLGDAGDVAAGGLGRAADAAKGLGDSAGGLGVLGDGLRGLGGDADALAAEIAAAGAEMDKLIAKGDALSARSAVSGASAASLNAKVDSSGYLATSSVEQDVAATQASKQAAADAEAAEASAGKYHMAALGGAAALAYGVDLAAKLQTGVTRLYTSAGESAANLPLISKGTLALSGQVGQSQASLLSGEYLTESAGFHGADALAVERSAGQGATAEGAQLGTVSNALTTLLNDYFGGPQKSAAKQQDQATSAMNAIMASVGSGKMTLQDLSSAMPVLLPTAKSAGLSLQQVLGAEATMTGQGSSAEASAQEIRHTITSIEKPTNVQSAEQQMLGINPNQLSRDLGSQGLTGTIAEVDKAIKTHMTSGGMVLLDTMNQSKLATQSANEEIAAMPANLQGAAKAYLDGSVSAKQWNAEMFSGSEPAKDKNLLSQFATTANLAQGYSTLVKAGGGNKQTVTAALNEMLGGQVGSQVALQVGGDNLKTFESNVHTAGDAAKQSGENIRGWGEVTKTLGFQLKSSEDSLASVATEAGQVALPTITTALKGLSAAGGFLASHPAVTQPLMEAGGVLAGAVVAGKVVSAGTTALASVGKIAETLNIPGLSKLSGLGKDAGDAGLGTAATGLKTAGADLTTAAGDLTTAAGDLKVSAGEQDIPGAKGPAGVIPGGKAAGAEAGASEAEEAGEAGAGGLGVGALARSIGVAGLTRGLMGVGITDAIARYATDRFAAPTPTRQKELKPTESGWQAPLYDFDKFALGSQGADRAGAAAQAAQQAERSGIADFFRVSSSGPEQSQFQSRFGISIPGSTSAPAVKPGASSLFTDTLGQAMASTKAAKIPAPDLSALDSAKAKVQADISDIDHIISAGKAAKIPAPDMSALETAKSKAAADLSAIDRAIGAAGKTPAKMAAPDLSPLDAAKTKAMSGGEGIQQAAQQAVSKPVRAAAPDLSPYVAARGKAASDGAAIDAGLAQGIAANAGAAVSAAESVANQVSAVMAKALDTHSPSKVTEAIGKDTSAGLAKGIAGGASTVKTSALTLSAATITSLTEGLQGGSSAIDAAMQAVTGKGSRPQDITTIISTISTLKGDVAQALSAGQIGKPEDSALTKMLAADNTKLQALSAQRTVIEQEITDAQQVAQAAISGASIMNAGTATPYDPSTVQSTATLIAGQQDQAQQAAMFAAAIGKDKSLGLNATDLNQIVQSGASAGLPVAQGIAEGGKGDVAQLNKLQSQIQASAGKLGSEAAGPMYTAGAQASQGFAQGLESGLGAIDAEISKMAKSMISQIEKDLKIHSPSMEFFDRGVMVPAGMAMGVDANAGQAAAAVGRMGSRMAGAFHPAMAYAGHGGGSGGGSGGSGGGGDTHYHVTVNVAGTVTSEQNLVNAVQRGLLKKGAVNWQTGARRPGSAG